MAAPLPDFYLLLHVDPAAPQEIIRASYRTLMQRLRAHPDLGGDHDAAAALNAAWATLRDPVRRAAYDTQRADALRVGGDAYASQARAERTASARRAEQGASPAAGADSSAASAPGVDTPTRQREPRRAGNTHQYAAAGQSVPGRGALAERCPFCLDIARDRAYHARAAETCQRCSAPLTLVQRVGPEAAESQRAVYRISRAESLRVYFDRDDSVGIAALVHDISVTGMRFSCARTLSPGAIVRTDCSICAAVARIAHAASDARGLWKYGAEFITVRFNRQRGSLLSVPV